MPEYATIQQHQPLRVPASFDRQGKALVLQLDEVFDDIYRRFGRLRLADMGKEFRKQIADDEGNIADLQFDLAGLTTRVTNAEGNIGSLQVTATALTGRMETAEGNIGALQLTATALTGRIETAEGNITTITADVSGLTTRVSTAEGDIGALEVRAGNIEIAVADKYSIVSGITIDSNGVDITGNKYVKIRSGGIFDVDAANFKINSSQGKIVNGNWTFTKDGLVSAMPDDYFGYVYMGFGNNDLATYSGYPSVSFRATTWRSPYNGEEISDAIISLKKSDDTFSRMIIRQESYGIHIYTGTDGSLNGTLQIENFVPATRFASGGMNNQTEHGIYYYNYENSDAPPSTQTAGITQVLNVNPFSLSKGIIQTVFTYDDTIYFRGLKPYASTWTQWKKVLAYTGAPTYGQLSGRA